MLDADLRLPGCKHLQRHGHFLVFELPILVAMRMAEEGLSREEAILAVLRDNLFGLELDPRCTQIAMFALALEAWKAGGYRKLPLPNVACCGIPARAPLSDWLALAGGDPLVVAPHGGARDAGLGGDGAILHLHLAVVRRWRVRWRGTRTGRCWMPLGGVWGVGCMPH